MVMQQEASRRPAAPASPPPPGRSRWSWPGLADPRWRLTAAAGSATMLSALALSPLLDGGWWLIPTALVIAVVGAACGLARGLRAPAPAQPLIGAAALLVSVTVLFARDEAVLGVLPGPAAIERLRQVAMQGRAYVEATVPPAGEDLGLLLLVVGGVGLMAMVTDTLACALDLPGATLLPLSGLFLVPWVIGHGSAPAWAFVVVALAWVGILAAAQSDWARRWAPTARAGRVAVGMILSGALALAALVAGSVAASREPILTLGSGLDIGQGRGTVRIDEMVSLRRSLVQNDSREILTFTTDAAGVDYLRLAILNSFDGERWTKPPRGDLEPTPPTWATDLVTTGDPASYAIDVGPLGGATLPSPAGTVGTSTDWPVLWDQRSALPSRADGRSVKSQDIELAVSQLPWDSETLRTASMQEGIPYGVSQSDRADPTDLIGPALGIMATEITEGQPTPYDQAVALQRWFTVSGGFRYSTEVEGGSGGSALDTFLTERVGYCEQFAATMALMARTLGIPARVVVGFTSGRQEQNRWVVRGTDAHAWPELWMGAAGWVRFEPTPGTATARVPSYTRERANGQPAGVPSAAASPGATGDDQDPSGRLPESADDATSAGTGAAAWRWRVAAAVTVVVVLLSVPALLRRARRRRRLSGDPESAFREVVDTARDHRIMPEEQATPRATIGMVAAALDVPPGMLETAIRASAGGPGADVRAALAALPRPAAPPGLASPPHEPEVELAVALARICCEVERRRYAHHEPLVGVAGGAGGGADVRGVAETGAAPDDAAGAAPIPPGDVLLVCAAITARSPRWRRAFARVAPPSLFRHW